MSRHLNQTLKSDTITKDNVAHTLVFFMVDWNGEDWRFLNNLNTRHEFWWHKWGRFRSVLTPGTFQCWLMAAYRSDAGESGNTLDPVAQVCTFDNLVEARRFNAAYLREYERYQEEADPRVITTMTLRVVQQLQRYHEIKAELFKEALALSRGFVEETWADDVRFAKEASTFSFRLEEVPIDDLDALWAEALLQLADAAEGRGDLYYSDHYMTKFEDGLTVTRPVTA